MWVLINTLINTMGLRVVRDCDKLLHVVNMLSLFCVFSMFFHREITRIFAEEIQVESPSLFVFRAGWLTS